MIARNRLVLRILRRKRALLSLGLLSLLGLTLLLAMATTAALLTLTPEQNAAAKLGPYQQRADVPVTLELGQGVAERLRVSSLGSDHSLQLMSMDFYLDNNPEEALPYYEGDWDRDGGSFGLRLVDGDWPDSPGEILVPATTGLNVGDSVSALGDRLTVTVSGIGLNYLHQQSTTVYAAPGTWSHARPSRSHSTAGARPLLFDRASSDPNRLADAIEELLPSEAPQRKDSVLGVEMSRISRTDLLANPPRSYLDRYAFVFAALAGLFPLLGMAFMVLIQRRMLLPTERMLNVAGYSPRNLRAAHALASGIAMILTLTCASLIGVGGPNALRSIIGPVFRFPIQGVTIPWKWLAIVHLATIAGLVCGLSSGSTHLSRTVRTIGSARLTSALGQKRVLLTAAVGLLISVSLSISAVVVLGPTTLTSMAPLTTSCCAAGVLCVLFSLLPHGSASSPSGLAMRLIHRHTAVVFLGAGIIAVTSGLAIMCSSLAATMSASENSTNAPRLSPDQVALVSNSLNSEAYVNTSRETRKQLGTAPPVRVTLLSATLPLSESSPGTFGIIAIESIKDFESLTDLRLDPAQRSTLLNHGMLVRDDSLAENGTATVSDSAGRTFGVDALTADFGPAWKKQAGGAILLTTSESLGLRPSSYRFVFDGLPRAHHDRFSTIAAANGIPPENVELPTAQLTRTPLTVQLSVWTACIAALLAAIAVGKAAGTTTAELKKLLHTLGLQPSWARGAQIWFIAFATAAGTVTAVLSAAVPLVAYRILLGPSFTLTSDWYVLAVTVGATFACALTAGVATRSRRSRSPFTE